MRKLKSTLRGKFIAVVVLTSAVTLALTGAVMIAHEVRTGRDLNAREMTMRADILAANSTASLAFDNPDDARQVLAALGADPSVIAAALYDADGHRFATYPAESAPAIVPRAHAAERPRFENNYLEVASPVVENGRALGTLYMRSDLRSLNDRIRVHALVVLFVLMGSVVVAFGIASWMQRLVTRPVLALAGVARTVSSTRDYKVRAPVVSDDELGLLTVDFNDMLGEIQRRDAENRQLNADLERRVDARTSQLEASNRELEAFSYSVSHDLRAPLRAIDGFSKALMEDSGPTLDDTGRRHLDRVRNATRHMGQLIDDMLDLARLSRAEMRRERVDLAAIANDIAASLRQSQPDRDVSFVIPPELIAEGDAKLLRVVLDNLIRNAWKFTSKKPHSRIELGSSIEDGRPVYVVSDDGAGFDMDHAKLLFAPFQRLHRQSEFEGTGVGLATVQRVIHRHGGRIWGTGTPGQGAAFHFTLFEEEPS